MKCFICEKEYRNTLFYAAGASELYSHRQRILQGLSMICCHCASWENRVEKRDEKIRSNIRALENQ